MRSVRILRLVAIVAIALPACYAQQPSRILAFTNGRWYDGRSFRQTTVYSVNGVLAFHRPQHIDESIDLHGGFVVPPFAEAHNHNVESLNKIDDLVALYLRHGIFYVKNPNNLARDRDALAPKLNRPESIDITFSNGSFTGSGGHPQEIPQRVIKSGKWTEADAEGGFYYTVDSAAEFERKWPVFLATKPDFVKTYLLYSDEYQRRKDDPHYFAWKGLDPTLLPLIVKKMHAAGLRVSTHIENAADFHSALIAGVDEINHMPGFRFAADLDPHPVSSFEVSESDARMAARQGTVVVTTLVGATQQNDPKLRRQQDDLNRRNLTTLLKHGVKIALGSDSYRQDTLPETLYLNSLHAMDARTLLNLWCTSTVQTIFPQRKVGHLREGYEASFLVLSANPLEDFSAVEKITMRVKQGRILPEP